MTQSVQDLKTRAEEADLSHESTDEQVCGNCRFYQEMREEIAKLRRAAEDKIAALLTPEQRSKYADMRGAAGDGGPRRATVYVLGPDGAPKAVRVMIGITDGTNTELVTGDIKAGDQVVVGLDNRGQNSSSRSPGRRFGL